MVEMDDGIVKLTAQKPAQQCQNPFRASEGERDNGDVAVVDFRHSQPFAGRDGAGVH